MHLQIFALSIRISKSFVGKYIASIHPSTNACIPPVYLLIHLYITHPVHFHLSVLSKKSISSYCIHSQYIHPTTYIILQNIPPSIHLPSHIMKKLPRCRAFPEKFRVTQLVKKLRTVSEVLYTTLASNRYISFIFPTDFINSFSLFLCDI
jgi:hypothetical protein